LGWSGRILALAGLRRRCLHRTILCALLFGFIGGVDQHLVAAAGEVEVVASLRLGRVRACSQDEPLGVWTHKHHLALFLLLAGAGRRGSDR